MRKLLLLIITTLFAFAAHAQDFPEGKYDNEEMQLKKYDKDTSAHAVVISEFGKAWISSADKMPLIFEYHVKIKIFDNKGFDQGNVSIPLYMGDSDNFETVRDIKGVTFYKDDNGLSQKTDLDPKKVYTENVNKHHQLVKFALPNLRNGCIIEYSYVVESPYRFNFHTWEFQSDIPKMYSEYEAHIPAIYEYNVTLRGFLKLSKSNAVLDRDCFSYYGTKADCSEITYAMSNIPAFVEESNMTSPANYISAIYFELSALTNQYGVKEKITKEWKDIDYELKTNDSFGSQMKRKDLLKDRLPPAILSITDTLTKAKAIYAYLQNWFKWDKTRGIYSDDGLKKALDNHSANVADINLSLVAALSAVGIPTEAVVLSTRDNGLINRLFPVVSDFDYVVARVTIDNKPYLLDATDPLLAFGMLPLRCINDQGRVMSLNKPSYWIDMVQTQRFRTTTALDLTLQSDGKIKGTITTYSIGYAAYEKRKEIKKFNTVDEYVEDLGGKLNRLKIIKSDVSNIDSLNLPLSEKYEVIIDASNHMDQSIAFDPAFWGQITENPFKLTERSYPVDMGSVSDHRIVLTMHYPDNFVISNQPAPVAITLPNKGGAFMTSFETNDGAFSYSQVQQLNKAIYLPEEYPYLKELYSKMIQNQKATIVFTKKL
jgi:hypothetical protein